MNISTTQTFQKILETLRSLERGGVKFWIQTPDGQHFKSNSEPCAGGHSRRAVDRDGVRLVDLMKPQMDAMQPGDIAVFDVPSNVPNLTGDAWRSAVSARCVATFGKGNYTTAMVMETGAIEVLRIK
jgi:hypothetical protein